MLNIVLFGPPGAGKGTQSEYIIEKYGFIHLSTGDLLRGEIAEGTALGIQAKQNMDKGELVPDSVVIGMIGNKVKANPEAKGFIFDGFPRTVAQAEALDTLLTDNNTAISGMISLEVGEEELVGRLLNRGETSGRADDKDESIIRNRIDVYNKTTTPVAAFYKAQDKLNTVEGVGSVEEIFGTISTVIDSL